MNAALAQQVRNLRTLGDVAALLGVSVALLRYHLYVAPKGTRYGCFTIPKRSGQSRTILSPTPSLLRLQRRLNGVLSQVAHLRKSVHGFAPSRGLLTNAQPHVGKKWVLNVDLENFFGSVNFGRVRGVFMAAPFSFQPLVATTLADLCCHGGTLPQGAPTSPTIANLVAWSLDKQLERLAMRYRCTYTRYADDLTFSTNQTPFPQALAWLQRANAKPDVGVATIQGGTVAAAPEVGAVVGRVLRAAVEKEGFSINSRKVHLLGKNQRQVVTGLTVNERLNVSRDFLRGLRALIDVAGKRGLASAQEEYEAKYQTRKHRHPESAPPRVEVVIAGKLSFLAMVRSPEDLVYRRLAEAFGRISPAFKLRPLPAQEPGHPVTKAIQGAMWYLDWASPKTDLMQGTAFSLGEHIVSCSHVHRPGAVLHHHATNTEHSYEVIVDDPALDLILLRLTSADRTGHRGLPRRLARPAQLEHVFAVGFPNFNVKDPAMVYPGQVTGDREEAGVQMIMTNASIIYGMSGGPLLDAQGRVVGVLKRGADNPDTAEDTEKKYAIPISCIDDILKRL